MNLGGTHCSAWVWAIACAVVGCGPKERSWELHGVTYVARADDPAVDATSVQRLVTHRETMRQYLGLEQAPALRYRKFLDKADLGRRSRCSAVTSGCFFAEYGVESHEPLDTHELIHAYTASLGDKPKIIEEGLAEALSCSGQPVQNVELSVEAAWSRASWDTERLKDLDSLYRSGARFVAYVLQVYGPHAFMSFYRRLEANDEFERASALFHEVFGTPLEATWEAALRDRSPDRACVYVSECAGPELFEPSTDRFAGDHEGVFLADGGTILSVRPVTGASSSELRLGGCEGTRVSEHMVASASRGTVFSRPAEVVLAPGKYWVKSKSMTVTRRASSAVFGSEATCTQLEPQHLVHGERTLLAFGSNAALREGLVTDAATGENYKIASDVGAGSRLAVECSSGVRVEVCESCDYTRCQVACETGKSVPVQMETDRAVMRLMPTEQRGFWVSITW